VSVVIVATWEAREGSAEDVERAIVPLGLASRAEPGCLEWRAHRSIEHPNRFVLFERYRDMDAVDAHRASEHFRTLVLGAVVPLLASRHVERVRAIE
jgi:quinol monooxygenase YgiN